MTHATLYTLANSLGILAMLTVVGYHFVAVNARHLAKNIQICGLVTRCIQARVDIYLFSSGYRE
ncbi:hypothetical protein BT96DRAFT_326772 [Gymnopus androsaceus JB14]|uniref:Uncharacterized protein n=1 Tax=Gymnopus androsaceus JB14 TaxID=1447944 RepID=A0A6A4I4W0_9AGAR|nr:hypothetical protein BT96DRAFT_326772 [Gymnopus androsaceus JB14]